MTVIIDGYNVLMQTSLLPRRLAPGDLEKARRALLAVMARCLDEPQRRQTIVVFDAKDRPRGAVDQWTHDGIRVCFAVHDAEADDLIERLIRRDSNPDQLVVVSNDRRLRQAAKRRGARSVEAIDWWTQLMRSQPTGESAAPPEAEPGIEPPLGRDEVENWLAEFGFDQPSADDRTSSRTTDKTPPPADHATWDVFPPGYGLDVLDDDEEGEQLIRLIEPGSTRPASAWLVRRCLSGTKPLPNGSA